MKTFTLETILLNLTNRDDCGEYLHMYDLCRDYVAQESRGGRKLRIYHAMWEDVKVAYLRNITARGIDRACSALRVDVLDDGGMIAYHQGHSDSFTLDMKVLRDLFDRR